MLEMELFLVFLAYIGFLDITTIIISRFIIALGLALYCLFVMKKNCIYIMETSTEFLEEKGMVGKFNLNLVGKTTLRQSFFMIPMTRQSALKMLVSTGIQ